jgi:hypothetical protein
MRPSRPFPAFLPFSGGKLERKDQSGQMRFETACGTLSALI